MVENNDSNFGIYSVVCAINIIENLRGIKMLVISEISKRTEIEDKLQMLGFHFVFNSDKTFHIDANISIKEFIEIAETLKANSMNAKTKNNRIGDVHIGGEINPQFRDPVEFCDGGVRNW